ncbi:MAG: glycosyltransferase [Janthinobacterium lividum]
MHIETKTPIVFLPCSGVGHINRGYESFTIQCFENLKDSKEFQLILLKSAGATSINELNISCIKRDSKLADRIFKILKLKPYWTEQISFCLSMLPVILKYKPALIYYSDTPFGKILWNFRKYLGFKYKLLLCNGAPKLAPFHVEDHIQQLLKSSIDKALAKGTSLKKQTLLPLGLNINTKPDFLAINKVALKAKLGLPANKKIIISVGAVSQFQKRMDYVVKEFSHLDRSEYFLIILGNISYDSKPVLDLATTLLQPNSYIIKQVKSNEVGDYLSIADYFTLASFSEGFGLVLIEALQAGLVPIVHDYDVVHEVLQQYGVFGDLSKENALLDLIKKVDQLNYTKNELWEYAYQNYSWNVLKKKYIKMISANSYQ